MLDNIPKVTERRKRAAEMVESLLKLLRSGWSPWVNAEDSRGYIYLEDALNKYSGAIDKYMVPLINYRNIRNAFR